ncbi:helix-turn-helix domain-containing protein [Photorhabdus sp. SF281]|uniref:helix-turn-helix domain-containing protein n=1 Tax=Photorhabdus sp. SF281 TaxID=3459527 RepID=UPI004044AD2C
MTDSQNNKSISQSSFSIPSDIDPNKDSYVIKGGAGLAVVHVTKPSDEVLSVRIRADGEFREMVYFNPSQLAVDERRHLERELYEKGHTHADIADLVGVSQPMVAYLLKRIR